MNNYFEQNKNRANTARALRDVGGLQGGMIDSAPPLATGIPEAPNVGSGLGGGGQALGQALGDKYNPSPNTFDFNSAGSQPATQYTAQGGPQVQGAFQPQPMNASQFAVTPMDKAKALFRG